MTRPGDQVVVYDSNTWKLGTRGNAGAFADPRAHIENLRFYDDGSLGPRPLWKKPVVSSFFDTYYTNAYGANAIMQPGVLRTSYAGTPRSGWVIVLGPAAGFVRFEYIAAGFVLDDLSATSIGTTSGPHAWIDRVGDYAFLLNGLYITTSVVAPYVTVVNGGQNLDTVFSGALTYAFGGSCYHNGRGFHWGPMLDGAGVTFNENRMYYSDLNAPGTFTSATQFFDMEWPIAGAASLGSVLLIWGFHGQWAALQGGRDTPANGTVVPLGSGQVPPRGRQPAVFDGKLVFPSSDLTTLVTVDESGQVDDVSLGHLGFRNGPANFYTAARPPMPAVSSVHNTVLIPWDVSGRAYHNQRGVWVEESWSLSAPDNLVVRFDDAAGQEHLYTLSGSTWTVYQRVTSETNAGPTPLYDEITGADFRESMSCQLWLPRVSLPNKQVRPTRVIVDGSYWGSAGYDAPAWEPVIKSDVANYDLVASETMFTDTAATGTSFRAELRPINAAPMASWFAVELHSMKSIAIERITVEYEVSEQETW